MKHMNNKIHSLLCTNMNKDEYEEQLKHNILVQRAIFEELDKQYLITTWQENRHVRSVYRLALEYSSNRAIVVYGAGKAALYTIDRMIECFLYPTCICDSNPQKQHTEVRGIPIISSEEFLEKFKDAYVVISSTYYLFAIYDQLYSMGIPEESIFHAPLM